MGILRRLGDGTTVDEAFEEASKFNVRRLYLWWEQTAKGTRQTPVPVVGLMKRRFKSGDVAGGAAFGDMETETRRHVRLGDLLRLRGHDEAAVREYREALNLADAASPEIAERLGGCLLNLGRNQETVDLLAPIVELYPSHPTGFVQLGHAYQALGKEDEAADMLERAIALNPFHPEVHCMLAGLHESRGQDESASVEESVCRMLSAGKHGR